jgi:hypothetical protein
VVRFAGTNKPEGGSGCLASAARCAIRSYIDVGLFYKFSGGYKDPDQRFVLRPKKIRCPSP